MSFKSNLRHFELMVIQSKIKARLKTRVYLLTDLKDKWILVLTQLID